MLISDLTTNCLTTKTGIEKGLGDTAIVRAYTDLKRHNLCDAEIDYYCNELRPQGRDGAVQLVGSVADERALAPRPLRHPVEHAIQADDEPSDLVVRRRHLESPLQRSESDLLRLALLLRSRITPRRESKRGECHQRQAHCSAIPLRCHTNNLPRQPGRLH